MINASSDSTRCWQGTTFIKVGVALTTVLTATAVALIVLGHLKMNVLLLPSYGVAGGAGLIGLLTLIQYLQNKCVYSWLTTPVTPKPDASISRSAQQPPDRSRFKEIVALPNDIHLGRLKIVEILPFHHIQLNPNDLNRLRIPDRSYIYLGDYVFTAYAAPEIQEGCIGMSLSNRFTLTGFKPIPNVLLERGIITPFRGTAPATDRLKLVVVRDSMNEALFYDPMYLQQQLVPKLQGHIFTHQQLLDTITLGGCDLRLKVEEIDLGEYRTVGAQTIINLIDGGYSPFLIPLDKTVPIEAATLTFDLTGATQFEGNKCLQLFPKTDGELSKTEIRLLMRLGIDPSEISEKPNIIPHELPDLNTLQPHILKKVQGMKSGVWSLPDTIGLVSTKAFWKVGEEFDFEAEGISYTMRLASIQAKGRSVSCATVGLLSNTPQELVIRPIPSTL